MDGRGGVATGLTGRAARLLLARGDIRPQDVHHHGVRVRDLSQSNGVALVEVGSGRGFLVKDMRPRRDPGQGCPERERALYRAASSRPDLARHVPAYLGDQEEMLVLEGLVASRRLDHASGGAQVLDTGLAQRLGHALGAWHRDAAGLRGFPAAEPWLLGLDRPGRLPVLDEDGALREVAHRITGDPMLRHLLARIRAGWRASTVIHGDVRLANVMVGRSVRLVDWETCGWGDPAWDMGAVIQEFLSVGVAAGHGLGGSPGLAPARAFLGAHRAEAGPVARGRRLLDHVAGRLLVRAVQLANWPDAGPTWIAAHIDLARQLIAGPDPLAD